MTNQNKSVIKMIQGNEYCVLVDDPKNIFNKEMFFYTVYQKSALLLKEICLQSRRKEDENRIEFFPNNIIMYCAERGGGKSSAMRSFANILSNLENEKKKEGFCDLFPDEIQDNSFYVLKAIDPTAISKKELFMRVILSRMFAELRDRREKDTVDDIRFKSLIDKFTDCYRLLDVIYQKGGEFSCDDALDSLTDLGDSCSLKDKFRNLVLDYLSSIFGDKNSEKHFLVIQIDDADLNSQMAYGIIEDIRKYCIVPNVVILMAVHIDQMYQVLDQHFAYDFKTLLTLPALKDESVSTRLVNYHKMSTRYIDKIMPAGHQIHLPTIDDYITNRSAELTVEYYNENGCNILDFKNNSGAVITDYQELLIRLIYNKTGIPIVKTSSILHNILPRTMRGLSHFLAYICPLDDLDVAYGISEINMLCDKNYDAKIYPDTCSLKIDKAKEELQKRKRNLDAFEQFFLKNWCPVRLSENQKNAILDISSAVSDQKISSAVKCLDRLFKGSVNTDISDSDIEPGLSPLSYSYLLEKLRKINKQANNTENAWEIYRFTYAIKLYFTLFFNRLILSSIENDGDFERILKVSNYEVWEPRLENIEELYGYRFMRFDINYEIADKVFKSLNDELQRENMRLNKMIARECIINISEVIHCAETEYLKSDSKKIICDFGAFLLNCVCSNLSRVNEDTKESDVSINTDESDLSEDNDTKSTNRLDFLNNLLMLLLNSDIQQCAEKASIKKIPNEIDFVDVNDLRKEAIAKIFDHLNARLDYLPIKWQMTELNSIMDNSMSTLQLYNLDIAVHAAQSMINTLKLSDLPTGLDDILGFTTTKSKIESAMEQLQYMPYVSYDKDLSQKIKRASDY